MDANSLMRKALLYEAQGDRENIEIVLENSDQIRKINCLESELVAIQNGRVDLIDHPTEFIAFLLSKGDSNLLYYFTSNIAGVRGFGDIHGQLEKMLALGWQLEFNLHNHNFFVSSENLRGGISPSTADAGLFQTEFKHYSLRKALITNGFETTEIDSSLFSLFSTAN